MSKADIWHLHVDYAAASVDFGEAFQELQNHADRLGMTLVAKPNGNQVIVFPGGNAADIMRQYEMQIK